MLLLLFLHICFVLCLFILFICTFHRFISFLTYQWLTVRSDISLPWLFGVNLRKWSTYYDILIYMLGCRWSKLSATSYPLEIFYVLFSQYINRIIRLPLSDSKECFLLVRVFLKTFSLLSYFVRVFSASSCTNAFLLLQESC